MDRNVVIATVLIAIIMVVWLTWLSPKPSDAPPTDPLAVPDTEAVQTEAERAVVDSLHQAEEARVDSTILGAQQGAARLITVENEVYRAVFSTRGATPVSFELKKYNKFDQKTPVQLISDVQKGSLGLQFTTPSNHNVDTRSFFFTPNVTSDKVSVTGGPQQLVFTSQVGQGAIRMIYTFEPDTYKIGLVIQQQGSAGFATNEGYEIVWDGGIPYSEDNLHEEARFVSAYASSGGEVEYIDLNSDASAAQRLSGEINWVAVKNKYFTAVVLPQNQTRGAELQGEKSGDIEAGTLKKQYDVRVMMPAPTARPDTFQLYVGPLEYYSIRKVDSGLYDMVDYGYDFFEWLTRPLAKYVFIPLFSFLGRFMPWGFVIIVFSILIKIVTHPLTKSSYTSMARMRDLQPKMEAIKEKYADNPQKQQEAMMKMYKETGVNPLGGCLPMLAQWPVLIALYQFFPQSMELRQASFLWANDLSAPDAILHLPFTIPFYGNFVAGFTLLMGLSMVVQMKVQAQPGANNPQAKVMMYMFPIMMFMFFNRFASGLSLYYLVFNILSAIQQKWINHNVEKQKELATDGKTDRKSLARGKAADTNGKEGRSKAPKKAKP